MCENLEIKKVGNLENFLTCLLKCSNFLFFNICSKHLSAVRTRRETHESAVFLDENPRGGTVGVPIKHKIPWNWGMESTVRLE